MAKILKLVISPDPLLEQVSKKVEKFDEKLRDFLDDMIATMHDEHGIGLAAVQVGVLKRILVMDVNYNIEGEKISESNPIYMINPEIIEQSKELSSYKEGCLSFPTAFVEVNRPKKVKIKFINYDFEEEIREFEDLMAVCVQHEIDHLNGITLVDHASRVKKEMILKKMLKLQKNS